MAYQYGALCFNDIEFSLCRESSLESWTGLTVQWLFYIYKQNIRNFSRHIDTHEHLTRRRNDIPNFNKLNRTRTSTRYYGVRFFNMLPTNIRDTPNNAFKSKLKSILILGLQNTFRFSTWLRTRPGKAINGVNRKRSKIPCNTSCNVPSTTGYQISLHQR